MNKWLLARETGWTLHYIENELDAQEIAEGLIIYDAFDRGVSYVQARAAEKARRSR